MQNVIICGGCRKQVETLNGEKFSRALDKVWHLECFRCVLCKNPIPGSSTFFPSPDKMPVCQTCNDATAGRCATCGQIFTGAYLTVGEQHFHEYCFTCCQCKVPLEGEFYENEGLFRCKKCQLADATQVCGICRGVFLEGQPTVTVKTGSYHYRCFVCSRCKQPAAKSFVWIDNTPVCQACHFAEVVCPCCGRSLGSEPVAFGRDKAYHAQCFACTSCKIPLDPSNYVDNGGGWLNCPACGAAKPLAPASPLEEPTIVKLPVVAPPAPALRPTSLEELIGEQPQAKRRFSLRLDAPLPQTLDKPLERIWPPVPDSPPVAVGASALMGQPHTAPPLSAAPKPVSLAELLNLPRTGASQQPPTVGSAAPMSAADEIEALLRRL